MTRGRGRGGAGRYLSRKLLLYRAPVSIPRLIAVRRVSAPRRPALHPPRHCACAAVSRSRAVESGEENPSPSHSPAGQQ